MGGAGGAGATTGGTTGAALPGSIGTELAFNPATGTYLNPSYFAGATSGMPLYTGGGSVGWKNVVFGPSGVSSLAFGDLYGDRLTGAMVTTPGTVSLINIKKNMLGRVPVQNNRMFLSDSTSPGTLVTPGLNTTNGSLIFSYFPFLGGIGANKINTILPYKASTVTADTKLRVMFYQCTETTSFSQLVPLYGSYVANNYFQSGFPSTNTYVNQLGASVNYTAGNANASLYTPLPKTLLGYSSVITILAGQGNQTMGHTQMFAADGTNGFFLPDGLIMMVVEMESTNATVGTFGRINKLNTITTPSILNCSPNWTNTTTNYYGVNLNKANCIQGSAFKMVSDGGMSSYTPPTTISDAELAAIFGGPGRNSPTSSFNWASLQLMVTFA
jgi:hypothetical protein